MANSAQHRNNMKLVDKVDRGMPIDSANDKDLLGTNKENKQLDDKK